MGRLGRVAESRVLPAAPAAIFDLLADPHQHVVLDGSGTVLDGSGTVLDVLDGPARLLLGATFTMSMSMSMSMSVHYHVRNVVVAFEENVAIAWRHFSPNVWRYDLEAVDGGTRVTESFTYDNATRALVAPAGFPGRNRRATRATLARLEDALSASR